MTRRSIAPLALLLLFLPALAFARDFFQMPAGDASMGYLHALFGQVTGTLSDTSTRSMMGVIFNAFNSVVIALGAIIVGYIYFVSTISTAHEGEVLGKNWSSLWIPARAAGGIALLIPTNTGYTVLQGFFFWVVIQGVGAADSLWSTALDYMKKGGDMVAPQTYAPATYYTDAKDMFKALVCSYAVPKVAKQPYQPPKLIKDFIPGPVGATTAGSETLVIGNYGGQAGYPCGTALSEVPTAKTYEAQYAAITAMVNALNPVAQNLVTEMKDPKSYTALKEAADTAYNTMTDAVRTSEVQFNQAKTQFIDKAKDQGWIVAGAYYYNMITLYEENLSIPNLTVRYYENLSKQYPTNMSPYTTLRDEWLNQAVFSVRAPSTTQKQLYPITVGAYARFGAVNDLSHQFGIFINNWMNQISGANSSSPILGLQQFGKELLTTIDDMIFTALSPVLSDVDTFVSDNSSIWAWMKAVISMPMLITYLILIAILAPIFLPVLIPLLLVGATMAYYIPLLPFLIFMLAGIAWLVSVIEAMIAAPLVALGLMHPEGHQVVGKAEPAILIIVNVFLRPALMILGLLAGISLSYVAVQVLNVGIYTILSNVFLGGINAIISGVAIIIIYGLTLLAIINKSFSLIYMIPDRIMRFIGGAPEQLGGEFAGVIQEIKSGFESGFGTAVKEGTGAVERVGAELKEDVKTAASVAAGGAGGGGEGEGDK